MSLDSEPTSRANSRRGFLRAAGGVAAGTALFVAGCDSNDDLTSNENPVAELSIGDAEVTAGEPVTFTYGVSDPDLLGDNLVDGISSVTLDFGDESMASLVPAEEETVTHTYEESGQYTATLTVQDHFSGSAAAMVEIGVDMPPFTSVSLDFSNNADVLNYAYMLEQLEAAFYGRVVAAIDSSDLSVSDMAEAYFRDLAAHEQVHRDFLAAAIPMVGRRDDLLPQLEVDFSSIDFGNLGEVLANAQMLEDAGVAAYNGAGIYLADNSELLTIAGKIVEVEARHAAAVRALIGPALNAVDFTALTDLNANTNFSLDVAASPQTVIDAIRDLGFVTAPIDDPTGLIENPNTPA